MFNEMKKQIADFRIRKATPEDVPLVLKFIRELAEYENMLDEVSATEDLLREWLFEHSIADVLIAEEAQAPVGFALYFYNFSTFLGKGGIYLEDLYVRPAARGKGYGKLLMQELAKTAVERGCGRLEWWCLDWNKSSIDFYLSIGAQPMEEWTVYRVDGSALAALAGKTG